MTHLFARATAHSNIALIKYWGKSDSEQNLPAVSSLSLTLDGMKTVTAVQFDSGLECDAVSLDGQPTDGRARERVVRLLDVVRARAGLELFARVESVNDFPTASGLASSASGFAALALAASHAAGLRPTRAEVSALARACSASAARSVFGGLAVLERGALSAMPLPGIEGWPLRMLVAVTTMEKKAIGSTHAMELCRCTSPYYEAWLAESVALFERGREAARLRDFASLGTAMEQSTLMMHATMMTARPCILYMSPSTVALIRAVEGLRRSGTEAYYTMDAGPHVKVLVQAGDAGTVRRVLEATPGVERVIDCGPGPAASVSTDPGEGS